MTVAKKTKIENPNSCPNAFDEMKNNGSLNTLNVFKKLCQATFEILFSYIQL